MVTIMSIALLVIAVIILLHILLFIFRALNIDLPPPIDKNGYLSSYDEVHAAGLGFFKGFKTLKPWDIPDCPAKHCGYKTEEDKKNDVGYDEEKDDEALYYNWSVGGWTIKWFLIYFVGKYLLLPIGGLMIP